MAKRKNPNRTKKNKNRRYRRTNKKVCNLTKEQLDALNHDAYAFWKFSKEKYIEIKNSEMKKVPPIFGAGAEWLSSMKVVWTNVGLALELKLKWLLYQDCGAFPKTHRLTEIYNEFSKKMKSRLESTYSGNYSQDAVKKEGELVAFKTSRKPQKPELKNSYNAPLETLSDMLRFIDQHDLLYEMRYTSVSYNSSDWNMYITKMDFLFDFINGLFRLVQVSPGNWGWHIGGDEWVSFGIEKLSPDDANKFFSGNGWQRDSNSNFTKYVDDGKIVVYDPSAYVRAYKNGYSVTKDASLWASSKASPTDDYKQPYLVAEFIKE